MKEIVPCGHLPSIVQEIASRVSRKSIAEGTQVSVRAIAEDKSLLGMRRREPEEDLAGIHTDSGEFVSDAIGCIERYRQALVLHRQAHIGS